MKIIVADKFPEKGLNALKTLGAEVTYEPEAKETALVEKIKGVRPDILIVRSSKVTKEMIEPGSLQVIIRAGAGYNTIDVDTASKFGVYVTNCPGKNSVAVSELAFGLLLSMDRRIPDCVAELRQGKWNKKEYSKAKGIKGQVLGLVGVGNIGINMVIRAKAFGMSVVACDPVLTPQRAQELGIELKANPEEVAASCTVMSVHVALTPETKGFINNKIFDKLPKGAYFINTSRAEVVDHKALEKAIKEKGVRAGLDVFEAEPASATGTLESEIVNLPGVYGTPHIGASTDQAQDEISDETVRIVSVFKNTGKVENCVNLDKISKK